MTPEIHKEDLGLIEFEYNKIPTLSVQLSLDSQKQKASCLTSLDINLPLYEIEHLYGSLVGTFLKSIESHFKSNS